MPQRKPNAQPKYVECKCHFVIDCDSVLSQKYTLSYMYSIKSVVVVLILDVDTSVVLVTMRKMSFVAQAHYPLPASLIPIKTIIASRFLIYVQYIQTRLHFCKSLDQQVRCFSVCIYPSFLRLMVSWISLCGISCNVVKLAKL